ncbi:putative lectin family integral membrane protein [Hyaloraphidium curvatum]|nr:putative lectin family integral membrane protein [Hyaloraphidium curvatum]
MALSGAKRPPRPEWTLFLAALMLASCRPASADSETLLPLRSFSLQSPYIDEQLGSRWFDFGGSTIVEVNNWVRLTPDVTSKSGWLYSKLPFTSTSWEIEFEFRVHGKGGNLFGDGFAFWYTKDKASVGPVFGNKDKFDGLGLFFDTYPNSRQRISHPYVMAMVGDGNTSYDNSQDGKPNEIGGCPSDFRSKDWPTKAKVRYIRDKSLEVFLDTRGDSKWELCFRADDVKLPTVGYIGFSALTGDISDNHDIISVNTNGIVINTTPGSSASNKRGGPGQLPLNRSPLNKAGTGGGVSWLTIIFILVSLAVVGGLVYVALSGDRRGKSSKRF